MQKVLRFLLISVLAVLGIAVLCLYTAINLNYNQLKPVIEREVAKITGHELKIEGDLLLRVSFNPLLRIEKVTFSNPAWAEHKQMLTVEQLDLHVNLLALQDNQLIINRIAVKGLDLELLKNNAGTANWELLSAGGSKPQSDTTQKPSTGPQKLEFIPVLKHAHFQDIQIRYHDDQAGQEINTVVDELELSSSGYNQPIDVTLNGSLNDHPFNINGLVSLLFDNGEISALDAQLQAQAVAASLELKGTVSQPVRARGIDVAISLDTDDLNRIAAEITGKPLLPIPNDSPLPLRLSAKLSDSQSGYALNSIDLNLAGSDLHGRLSLMNGPERPKITATLVSDTLNIDELLPASPVQQKQSDVIPDGNKHTGESKKTTLATTLPDTPIPFHHLKSVDADINLRANRVLAAGFVSNNVALDARLKDARLQVKRFDLDLAKATIRTRLLIDSGSDMPEIQANLDITRLDIADIAHKFNQPVLSRGSLNSTIKLTTHGDNVRALVLGLKGKSRIKLKDIHIKPNATDDIPDFRLDRFNLDFLAMHKAVQYSLTANVEHQPMSLSGKLTSPLLLLNNKPVAVDLDITALKTELKINGTVKQPMQADHAELDIGFTIPEPKESVKQLKAVLPDLDLDLEETIPALPVHIKTRLEAANKSYGLKNLQIKAGRNDMSGQILADLRGSRPLLEMKLASKQLDVDSLLPPSSGNGTAVVKDKTDNTKSPRLFPDDPLPLDALNKLDVSLHCDIEQLQVRGIRVDNIRLRMQQKNGNINIEPLQLEVAGGSVDTVFSLEGDNPASLKLDVNIDDLNYDQLFRMTGSEEYASGKVDAKLDLSSQGDSVRALMAGLDGKLRITTVDGTLNSSAMRFLGQDIASLIPFSKNTDKQKIQCGVVAFDVTDGLADTRALVFNTGVVSAVGTGSVNLKTEKLALYVEPRTRRTSVLKIAMVPVNITGTLANPSVKPDAAGTAVSTTKTAANIGLAIATGGITLAAEGLTEKLWASVIDETDYCALALSGKKVEPSTLIGPAETVDKTVESPEVAEPPIDIFDDY